MAGKNHKLIQEEGLRRMADDDLARWSALVGGLAHELKNPLSTLHINLQLLREDLNEEPNALRSRCINKIDVMLQESERLEQMLADFLRLTSPASLDRQSHDLNELIGGIIQFMDHELNNKGITVTCQLDRSLPKVSVDENLLRQALINLIKNAADAIPDSGGSITFQTHLVDDTAVIDLIDTGVGMTTQTLDQAFNFYFSTKVAGTGLGLPMVKRIIERHGGDLECASEAGMGTKFSIHLPATRAHGEDR